MRYKIAILILLFALPALAREGGSITPFVTGCFTATGDGPLAGGKLNFFEPGSTTVKPVFENNDLTGTVEAGVLTLDAAGRLPQTFYGDGLYLMTITTADGATVETYDNIRFGEGVVNTSEVRLAINAQTPLSWNAGTGIMSLATPISSDLITDTGHTNKFFTTSLALAAVNSFVYEVALWTANQQIAAYTSSIVIVNVPDPVWTTVSDGATGTFRYTRHEGIVFIYINRVGTGTGFTLPAGYRPKYDIQGQLTNESLSSNICLYTIIATTGALSVHTGSYGNNSTFVSYPAAQ